MSNLQLFCSRRHICSVSIYTDCSDCSSYPNTIDLVMDDGKYIRIRAESVDMYDSWINLGSSTIEAIKGRILSSICLTGTCGRPGLVTDQLCTSCQVILITFQDGSIFEPYLCSNSPCLDDARLSVSMGHKL